MEAHRLYNTLIEIALVFAMGTSVLKGERGHYKTGRKNRTVEALLGKNDRSRPLARKGVGVGASEKRKT